MNGENLKSPIRLNKAIPMGYNYIFGSGKPWGPHCYNFYAFKHYGFEVAKISSSFFPYLIAKFLRFSPLNLVYVKLPFPWQKIRKIGP